MFTLSIIIPVYNERATVEKILQLVDAIAIEDCKKEIIIIDDCSTDGTRNILQRYADRYTIILKEKNEGKGAAVKEGFLRSSGDITIIQDADLEYDPREYPLIIEPIVKGAADVVYGSRFVGSKPHRVLNFWHFAGNRLLTTLSNMFTNLNITDMETCYKAFNRTALDIIKHKITAKRFGIEPELTALIAKNNLRVYEVGISYYGRTYKEGKKINWKDGLAALYYIIKYNLFHE